MKRLLPIIILVTILNTALHAIGTVERELRESVAMRKQVEFLSKKLETGKF